MSLGFMNELRGMEKGPEPAFEVAPDGRSLADAETARELLPDAIAALSGSFRPVTSSTSFPFT